MDNPLYLSVDDFFPELMDVKEDLDGTADLARRKGAEILNGGH